MSRYRRVGLVPAKRHTVARDQAGNRLLEELMGSEGFSGPSSLLYHRWSPSALRSVEAVDDNRPTLVPNHPVAPLHLRTGEPLGGPSGDPSTDQGPDRVTDLVGDRRLIAGNDDIVIAMAVGDAPSPIYRNAMGDELIFIHQGSAELQTSFGPLEVHAGDYVTIPAGTTHRWVPRGPARALVIEASGHLVPPRRYLTDDGQFREWAPYCERDLRAPEHPPTDPESPVAHSAGGPGAGGGAGGGRFQVLVRTRHGMSRHRYDHDPFDVVGWDGCLYPQALSIHDFEPIVGSLHQPPPVHQTFEGPGLVVCSFVPRPFDFHPDAVKVPYHHSNVDSDEVLFYVDGDFMSRAGAGIGVGSITIHPAGFVHGPQPGSWERSVDATRTDETAVMIDTFKPLLLAPATIETADPDYVTSWVSG